MTAMEVKQHYTQALQEHFARVNKAIQTTDLTKTETRVFNVFSKETLRAYLRNPKSNETNLRNLSNYLWRMCHTYRRIGTHNAQMLDLKSHTLIPTYDPIEGGDPEATLKELVDTGTQVDKMCLDTELYKMALIAWREDAAYGYTYEDDSGFFIMPLDGQYCRISSINLDGTFNFAYDFSYFRSHEVYLDYWDSEFRTKYNKYINDPNLRWQELEPSRTICLKINCEDLGMCTPPFVALFEMFIDLIDLQSIQNVKDELSIYKLLVARLDTQNGADTPDEFKVDIDTALQYYDLLESSLPDCVGSVFSLLPIDTIDFKGNTTEDTDMISNAESNILKRAGGSEVLGSEKSGTEIFKAQIIAEANQALTPLLGQIEKWVNRYLTFVIGEHAKVKYFKVSPFTKEYVKKAMLESAQNSLPEKLAVASLDGFSVRETLAMAYLENEVLKLHESWIPLSTSYTQSNAADPIKGGAPKKDSGDLSSSGSDTREGKN